MRRAEDGWDSPKPAHHCYLGADRLFRLRNLQSDDLYSNVGAASRYGAGTSLRLSARPLGTWDPLQGCFLAFGSPARGTWGKGKRETEPKLQAKCWKKQLWHRPYLYFEAQEKRTPEQMIARVYFQRLPAGRAAMGSGRCEPGIMSASQNKGVLKVPSWRKPGMTRETWEVTRHPPSCHTYGSISSPADRCRKASSSVPRVLSRILCPREPDRRTSHCRNRPCCEDRCHACGAAGRLACGTHPAQPVV